MREQLRWVLAWLLVSWMTAIAPVADAAHPAHRQDRKALRAVVLKTCGTSNPCTFDGARISSRNGRFAYASAAGQNFSPEGILKRRTRHSHRWHWVIQQSGGPDRCANYRKVVPLRVLREFRIMGFGEGPNANVTERC